MTKLATLLVLKIRCINVIIIFIATMRSKDCLDREAWETECAKLKKQARGVFLGLNLHKPEPRT